MNIRVLFVEIRFSSLRLWSLGIEHLDISPDCWAEDLEIVVVRTVLIWKQLGLVRICI